ncbi:Protein NDNF [Dufourea novaeangliae]|uniref:Protein NDNF n=1 Tax=Dufourea novaeangliae TaxID=178035 RepID=A0A154PIB5_DUFNO|nr:Protein NDNF [Dufourea novaeangliae]
MLRHCCQIGFLLACVSVFADRGTGCAFCEGLSQQQSQLQQLQQFTQHQGYRTIGSPRPFGAEKPTRVQEFNRTGVLHPEYQIPATLRPGNVSQFYYLSPRGGPPLTLLVSPCSGPISWTVSYVEPPENTEESEGAKSQTRWPVKTLKPGSPLFTYQGAEDQNFTISKTRAGLYWFEIKSVEPLDASFQKLTPSTVLLYATSSGLDHIPEWQTNERKSRHRSLRFQQRRSKRRLTVSWNKSSIDPHLSRYCLAVTSGSQPHPLTLCAAQNVLHVDAHPTKGSSSSKEQQHRGVPEGLHCVRQTKLTLHRMKYDTTYNFTLYVVSNQDPRNSGQKSQKTNERLRYRDINEEPRLIGAQVCQPSSRASGGYALRLVGSVTAGTRLINTRNNVSNRVTTDAVRFRKTPELILRTGSYTTASLRKTDGFVNFRYRPPENTSSTFHILPCGGGIVKAKLTAPGILREKEVVGYASLRVPPLTSGKSYTLRISATPQELARVLAIKVLATQESSTIFPQIPSRSTPREYRSLRTCHEVTIGVESAGAAKYCILVRELRSASSLASVTTIPDQCGLHRRRRSEYTFEVCEEKSSPPKDRALPFTLKRLQPGKAYLLQITAQLKGQSLSYPLLGVRTRRTCLH